MGLLVEFLGFILVSLSIGLAFLSDEAYFEKDWMPPMIISTSVFCAFSGLFCIVWGIILMVQG